MHHVRSALQIPFLGRQHDYRSGSMSARNYDGSMSARNYNGDFMGKIRRDEISRDFTAQQICMMDPCKKPPGLSVREENVSHQDNGAEKKVYTLSQKAQVAIRARDSPRPKKKGIVATKAKRNDDYSALVKRMGAVRLSDNPRQDQYPLPIIKEEANSPEKFRITRIRQAFLLPENATANQYEDSILLVSLEKEDASLPCKRRYMNSMAHVTIAHRIALVSWLVDTHYTWNLSEETLFLTISFLDRFMAKKADALRISYLRVIGTICLNICSKYEDIHPFCLKDVREVCPKWSVDDIAIFEAALLTEMNFNVSVPTPLFFLKHYIRIAAQDAELFCATEALLAEYLITLALHCADLYTDNKPSVIAATALYIARRRFDAHPLWTENLRRVSNFSPESSRGILDLLYDFWKAASKSSASVLTAVRKFSSKRFLSVSLLDCDSPMTTKRRRIV